MVFALPFLLLVRGLNITPFRCPLLNSYLHLEVAANEEFATHFGGCFSKYDLEGVLVGQMVDAKGNTIAGASWWWDALLSSKVLAAIAGEGHFLGTERCEAFGERRTCFWLGRGRKEKQWGTASHARIICFYGRDF